MRICKRGPAAALALALALMLAGCSATAARPAPSAPVGTPVPAVTAAPTPAAVPSAAPTATPAPWNEVCELYRQVLEDLWQKDEGLNSGITVLGLDLSTAPGDLTAEEKAALAQTFGAAHGLEVVQATWQELADAGTIDAETLSWEDGILFTIRADPEAAADDGALHFTAEKWRSGLGAYIFVDCTAQKAGDGWQYTVGAEAIA